MREGAWREEVDSEFLSSLQLSKNNNLSRNADEIRNTIKD